MPMGDIPSDEVRVDSDEATAGSAEGDSVSAPQERKRPDVQTVGIGASAGGLRALKEFFAHVPENSGLAYVVVVHLSPEHESHLADLLQPNCHMPVTQVAEAVELQPNHVYVIPPNANLNSIDTHLRLSDLEERRSERAPIDHFFRTLAEVYREFAIGVVLTGTGSDGTLGLRRIKEYGGLTVVQAPEEAEYDGMPRSAIGSGAIDMVLPLADIPPSIVAYSRAKPIIAIPDDGQAVSDEQGRILQQILALVRAHTGNDFTFYKRGTIMRRIRRRMQIHRRQELSAYLELLRKQSDEVQLLFEDLLITVTEFFRDEEVFKGLQQEIIPRLFRDKAREEHVRVWSVGCATGEEVYSLTILLLEEAAKHAMHPQVQLFASDLHEHSLKIAREGVYPDSIAAQVSPERLERFFTKENGSYRVRREVREQVVFAPHNLLKDPPFSQLDLVVCRNLLIYLRRDVQQNILSLFHYALKPDGYLTLGSSEAIDSTDLFIPEEKSRCVYRRRSTPTREPGYRAFAVFSGQDHHRHVSAAAEVHPVGLGAIHQKMVEGCSPPSILVSAEHEIAHSSADAWRYLRVPGGEATSNVFKLLRDPLQIELHAALHAAKEQEKPFRARAVPLQIEEEKRLVSLRVIPAKDPDMSGFYLVLFDEKEDGGDADSSTLGAGGSNTTVRELEVELDLARKRLQALIDDHETASEGMQAANEELQSINEELRSTMEELETSKEELQSMNEELTTVNQENKHKVDELGQLSSDLQNLLTATDIATLFLDRELRIVRFTPRVAELFNVRHSDRGRPVMDLTHRLGYNTLQRDAARVLDGLVPIEREVKSEGDRWFFVRVLPYRTVQDHIEGVVITFIDITERRRAEDAVRESEQRYRDLSEKLDAMVRERTAQLEEQTLRLRGLAVALSTAEQRERKRLAAILHDDLQQLLVAGKMHLAIGLGKLETPRARAPFEATLELLDEAVQTTRDLSNRLRPPALYEAGLAPALNWLVSEMREKHGLAVHLEATARSTKLPDDAKALLFDSVREFLFNIVKHAGVAEATLTLEEVDGQLRLAVGDEGKGFDIAEAEASNHDSGYGLFSVRERVNAIGGRVTIDSAIGKGTHLLIEVPLAASAALKEAPSSGLAEAAVSGQADFVRSPGGRPRVLVVDDHAVVRDGIASAINDHPGLTLVGKAADGVDALSAIEAKQPDIVLLDVNMPRMNGFVAAREIHRRWPHILLVGLSVQDDEATANAMVEAGCVAFVSKASDSGLLFETLLKLSQRRSGSETTPDVESRSEAGNTPGSD